MSRQQTRALNRSAARLSGYLAAGLGATGLASVESEAAVVSVDITNIGSNNQNISGINAGITEGQAGQPAPEKLVFDFPVTGADFRVVNRSDFKGFTPFDGRVAFATGIAYASPFRFSAAGDSLVGPSLPANTSWSLDPGKTTFSYDGDTSADWPAGSYIGFRARVGATNDYNYGYFEVTWNNVSNQFEILSGAYESTVNTPISVVPEPSASALTGIGALALGAGAIRRSRRGRNATAETSLGEAV